MTHHLKHRGYHVNRKRIQRLMRLMGIEAIYPQPKRSTINYNGPQYSGQELSKKFGLTHPYKWRIENVNQTDSSYSEIQVYYCR
jgi:transposase InsO family protein